MKENAQRIMQRIQGDYIKQYHNTHQDMANYVVQEMFLRAVGEKDTSSHYSRPRRRRAPTPGSSGDGDGGPPHVTPRDKESPENKKKLDRNYPNVSMLHEGVLSRIGKLEQEIWDLKKTASSGGSPEETEGLSVGKVVEKLQEEMSVQGGRVRETEAAMEEARATVRGTQDAVREMEAALRESQAAVTELKSLVELQGKRFQEELQSMTDQLAALCAEVEEGRKEKSQIEGGKGVSLHLQELIMSPESAQRNRDIVNTLNAAQVLQLLIEVGVDDLQLITQEKITGDILLELNEDELESELGIKKKIHRLKVMKVINGSKPITDYLTIPNSMDALC